MRKRRQAAIVSSRVTANDFRLGSAMKPRHAAALALVGWALLQPPLNSEHKFDQGRPLYEWTYFGHGTYETAQACSEDLERFKSPEFNSKFLSSLGSDYRANIDLDDLVCVPSDDPRLSKTK